MKHKHYELIVAWANGAVIEYLSGQVWLALERPQWYEAAEYREKPTHAELIKAYKEGANIEWYNSACDRWENCYIPSWNSNILYRVKSEPKPDIIMFAEAFRLSHTVDYGSVSNAYKLNCCRKNLIVPNLKLTYSGDTNKLKSIEMI